MTDIEISDDELIAMWFHACGKRRLDLFTACTYESGPYSITKPTMALKVFAEMMRAKWNNQTEVLRLQAEIARLNKALLALSRAYSDWPMNVSDEDEQEISALIRNAESDKQQIADGR